MTVEEIEANEARKLALAAEAIVRIRSGAHFEDWCRVCMDAPCYSRDLREFRHYQRAVRTGR
jgi:hypothetical protein